MLAQDQRLMLRLTAEELGISKDMAHTIVCDDLGKRKILLLLCATQAHRLAESKRMETSGDFISMCDQDPLLLENIVMGDET